MNNIKEGNGKLTEAIKKNTLNKEERKELKSAGVNVKDREAVKEYFKNKAEQAKLAEEQAKKEEEEKARLDRLANPTTEDLLKQIKNILKKSIKSQEPVKARKTKKSKAKKINS
jgi:hypothetical protein